MFDFNNIKVLHLEMSNFCNAKCPMCPRERPMNSKIINTKMLTLEKVKALFNEDFIKRLEIMYMCGNLGDPAAAQDTIEIFKYFREINPHISLSMHSNGGLRSTRWWGELGKTLSGKNDYCVFGIDGLADTNHIYRVNTQFEKIMENSKHFIDAGGNARWHFLVFEHNEHQVEEARLLSKQLGFSHFQEIVSCRFEMWSQIKHIKAPIGGKYI